MKKIILAFLLLLVIVSVANATTHQKYKGWENVVVPGVCSFQIPPTMELQSAEYTELAQQAVPQAFEGKQVGIIAQQKGLNTNTPEAQNTYARIMVNYFDLGEHLAYLGEKLYLTNTDLQAFNNAVMDTVNEDMEKLHELGHKGVILSWQPTKVININGQDCLFTSYRRQTRDNPPATVLHYIFFNHDRMHMIRIAYREKDASLWKNDLHKAINTFDFVKR